ncbi:S-layer protein domain-containing protein [Methanococcoides alaskense]|uniref:S-layer family duplication domain-containing protein n=1 Tax=Methanococcoides alaskense TaxID=325778 RepID=A0AA90TYI8_9EURY|nr:S-layer protein domain-containing protein [Methanococcoides alaskense]MDA0524684.1 hypothetical protein [Methanococcoides alaskense]MDR6222389.1 hypothetical protein [Methanococcoides alaskense]
MKYIHFVIIGFFAMLLAITPATALDSTEPIIHYSESVIDIGTKLTFDQGYTLHISDINENNGDIWVEVLRDGKVVKEGDGAGQEDDPFEYILTVEAEDADEEDKEYLVFRVTPKDVVSKDPASAKIRIEQFHNPEEDLNDLLIYDDSRSVNVGEELDLEEGFSLKASNYDDEEETITITLEKNGHLVKEMNDMEKGEIFSHYKTVNGEITTIVIANIYEFFDSSETIVFLKEVSQREDVIIESNVEITIEGLAGDVIRENERAIIHYELDNDASEIKVYVDDDRIDTRKEVDEGKYASITDKMDTGTYEVTVTIVSEDGSVYSEDSSFTVEKSNSIKETSLDVENTTKLNEVIEDTENVTDAVSEVISDSTDDVKGSSVFSYVVVAILIALTAFFLKREFS